MSHFQIGTPIAVVSTSSWGETSSIKYGKVAKVHKNGNIKVDVEGWTMRQWTPNTIHAEGRTARMTGQPNYLSRSYVQLVDDQFKAEVEAIRARKANRQRRAALVDRLQRITQDLYNRTSSLNDADLTTLETAIANLSRKFDPPAA